jgi:hypothetical protein
VRRGLVQRDLARRYTLHLTGVRRNSLVLAGHIASLHPQTNEGGQADDRADASLDPLIRRLSGISIDEIDRVIRELERVRERLPREGERVNREIADYADLARATITSMRAISGSIRE